MCGGQLRDEAAEFARLAQMLDRELPELTAFVVNDTSRRRNLDAFSLLGITGIFLVLRAYTISSRTQMCDVKSASPWPSRMVRNRTAASDLSSRRLTVSFSTSP
jgi:hypothetical protein